MVYQEGASFILVGIVLILAYFVKNIDETNVIAEYRYLFSWLKLLFLGMSLFLMTALVSFGSVMLSDASAPQSMIDLFDRAYIVCVILALVTSFVLVLYFIFFTLKLLASKKEKERKDKYGQ